MSDRSIGDFARLVRHDPDEAARLLLAAMPDDAVVRLINAIEEQAQAREGWRLNNRQVVDNIADPGRAYPMVTYPGGSLAVDPPRPEVKHMVRSTVWVRALSAWSGL